MKKMSVLLGLAAAASLSLASCQKELEQVKPASQQASAAATISQSKSELLTASPWHLTDMKSTTVATATTPAASVSLMARLKPWMRDNVITYAVGGGYTIDEAALKIRPQAPQQLTGTWKLSESGDSLTVTRENGIRRFGVAELTAAKLRLTHAEAGTAGTIESVFSH